MNLNVNSIQKQEPVGLQQQPHITIHQLPMSNSVVSYTEMANPISTSTLHIQPTLVGNPSSCIQPSTNVNNLGSSLQNNSAVTLNPTSIGLAVLSDSTQLPLKAEYTEPKTEYS